MDLKEKQIIYVDNKPHIKCGVAMLYSQQSKMCQILFKSDDSSKFIIKENNDAFRYQVNADTIIKPFHLYITSNEEIKEGEWYCSPMGIVSIYNGIEKLPSNWRKIIATTDELYLSELFPVDNEIHSLTSRLPQPSQQFIEKYIEEYNKGNIITEILVEVEEIKHYSGSVDSLDVDDDYDYIEYKLKLDSQNQITIRKQKDSWSRKEVIDLISDWTKMKSGLNMNLPNNFNQWIEENL